VSKTYSSERARDLGIKDMTRRGYSVQAVNSYGGQFKSGKATLMLAGGSLLLGPVGLLAGGFAGHKKVKWNVVFVKEK
jgi:hypothetical protein